MINEEDKKHNKQNPQNLMITYQVAIFVATLADVVMAGCRDKTAKSNASPNVSNRSGLLRNAFIPLSKHARRACSVPEAVAPMMYGLSDCPGHC